jgi:DNA-binding NtrC family response regulator
MKREKPDYQAARHERILVIDDDKGIGAAVMTLLETKGYKSVYAESAEEGVQQGLTNEFDLVITDLRLGKSSGLEVISSLKSARPSLPVILMTSFSSVDSAVQALRNGAVDYIMKPFDNDDFMYSVERALNERRMHRENALLKKSLKKAYSGKKIIGESASIKKVMDLIRRVAPSDASVLIQGESGTGKELVAQAIHFESGRRDGPFVPVNCGAIPADLMESELFGHVKGAYTGATSGSEGLIREAHGGTLFLDEISELPTNLQVKLLRALQEREVRSIGGKDVYQVDVRILAASNKDLKKAVEKGEFREDLFYRLNVINILVPPLREREKDVEILADYFIEHYSKKMGKPIRGTTKDFIEFLNSYHWPGNVRELQNLVERAVILADSEMLNCAGMADSVPAPPRGSAPVEANGKPLNIEDYIRYIVTRYQATHGEVEIAQMLGIGRKALWVRRRRWGMTRDASPDEQSGS